MNSYIKGFFLTLSLSLVLGLQACKSGRNAENAGNEEGTVAEATAPTDMNSGDDNSMGDSDSGRAMGLKTVYFPYDSFDIVGENEAAIEQNVEILTKNATAKIQIEGHCDQRGGIQYNLALGEKRANAIKSALTSRGVESSRVSTISYGKERPVDPSTTDDAYARNRRGNFVVTAK